MDRILCFMDLNGFKKVNVQYGREEGNKVINHFGSTIALATKKREQKDAWLVRYTGDEYVLLFEYEKTSVENELMRSWTTVVHLTLREKPYKLPDGTNYFLSVACGIVRKSDFPKLTKAIDEADYAMSISKRLMKEVLVDKKSYEPNEENPPAGIIATLSWNQASKELIDLFKTQNIAENENEVKKLYQYAKTMQGYFPDGYFISSAIEKKYESSSC